MRLMAIKGASLAGHQRGHWHIVPMHIAAALALVGLGLALSAPAAASAARNVEPGTVVCTVDDPRAVELSGLVATADGYVSLVDSQFDSDDVRIVYLDRSCRVTRTVGFPTPPRDPEDLAVAPDGTVWAADIGDNIGSSTRRQSVALWRVPPGGGPPVIHRLTYPDGPHDAEALLFATDGNPVIVTKEIGGTAYLYQPTGPLQPDSPVGVPMRRVGEFSPTPTGIANPLGAIGETAVTGAATAPDRSRVALRTYTAAYEWDMPDGDIVKAITTGTPRFTPLPDEPQGEAIAYTVDGQDFLTLSDESGPTEMRRYRPSTEPAPVPPESPVPTETSPQAGPPISTPMLWYGFALAAVGGGLLIATVAYLAVRRFRTR
jgi:hypothetical protein